MTIATRGWSTQRGLVTGGYSTTSGLVSVIRKGLVRATRHLSLRRLTRR